MTSKIRFLLLGGWLTALTLAVLMLSWGRAQSQDDSVHFGEITAERLNIVEPDGQYRLVLANEERFPGLYMEGKEYLHHSRSGGGMLFFNDEGDEVGGMSFGSEKTEDGYSASAGIMFDQYKQDQTIGIRYSEANGERVAGLKVWDRPDYSIEPLMKMSDRAARADSEEATEAIRQEMLDYAMAHGGVGAERMFVGKRLTDSIVELADAEGRPRLVLKVAADGRPSVEFLNEDGEVVRRITDELAE